MDFASGAMLAVAVIGTVFVLGSMLLLARRDV
jgi:hypothetical protein